MASPQSTLGWMYAGIEFFASMQWTALSVVLAQQYQDNDASFASGIQCMSMASVCGQLFTKFVGMTLLQYLHWRTVAQLGAVMALIGLCIVQVFVKNVPPTDTTTVQPTRTPSSFQWNRFFTSIQSSASKVLSNPLIWAVGYAHAMSMVAKSSDRILGEFYSHATGLPR
jgi:dipeptide/tripeptide permease